MSEHFKCRSCCDSGYVSMIRSDMQSSYGFACSCPAGADQRSLWMQRWNGQRVQIYKNTPYYYTWADFYNMPGENPKPKTFIEHSQPSESEIPF